MLTLNDDGIYIEDLDTITVLSIDPGTTCLGFAITKLSIPNLEIVEVFGWTIDATRLSFYREDVIEIYGEKFARIMAIKQMFKLVLEFHKPLCVVCESPFFSIQRPSAAGPLYELLATLEQTVYEWDSQKPLYKIDPKTVKKAVKASHNAKKDEVKLALSIVEELKIANLDYLDQHAIDAVAVGYGFINLNLRNKKEI